MEVLVEATGLHSHRGVRHVLKGVDLTVHRNEIIGLVGANGSGKSTLAQVISGALRPSGGSMTVAGEPYRPNSVDEARSAGVSIIEQEPDDVTDMTVAEAMYRHTHLAGQGHDAVIASAREVLARTTFDLSLDAQVADLSPSERAVAEVLRVLTEEAQLIVFDEASAWLHDMDIVHLHEAARRVCERGGALVYVAHRIEEVMAISDRVAVMRDGVIVADLDTRSVAPDELVRAMLGRDPVTSTQHARSRADEIRLSVRGLSVDGAVSDVDLDLHRGEVLGVLGLRGSGAHELVEAVAAVRPCRTESVTFDGKPLTSITQASAHMAYLAPTTADLGARISDSLTRADDSGSELGALRRAVTRAHHLQLTSSDIRGPVGSLSGGDRQKVSLIETLRSDADVFVLSHPTRGIDLGIRERVHALIDDSVTAGSSVVFFSTNVHELLSRCDRVLVVHDGRAVATLRCDETHEDMVMDLALTGVASVKRARRRR